MESQPFYFELEDQLKMFLTAIDGCIATRYDNGRVARDKINVRYVYAPKQRALHDLLNKAQHITLPVVAYVITGLNYDTKREFNKLSDSHFTLNGVPKNIPQPIPIKIDLDVSYLVKFQHDFDQIFSNLISAFRPYIAISWNRFNLPYHEIRNKVYWSGRVTPEYPVDINENQPTRIVGNTSFSIEGWLFSKDAETEGLIRTIDASFYAISSISNNIVDLEFQVNEENTEMFTISGMPMILGVYPTKTITYPSSSSNIDLHVYGTFIRGISSAYLSSNTVYPSESSTLIDIFSGIPSLSADNLPFNGFPVEFQIASEYSVIISIPPPLSSGSIDIVFTNSVGCGKLTDSIDTSFLSGVVVY